MIVIENKAMCCGCTACYSICPKHCIVMKTDKEGFKYPFVDKANCIQCSLCEKTCPILYEGKKNGLLGAVAVQNKTATTLYHSAAGGAYTAIASKVIQQGGVAYGAGYDHNIVVKHSAANSENELEKFRSSKYVQSNIGDTFVQAKRELDDGKMVCYSGTPCQIAGFKKFLKKDYSNLVTVDLICKGVASPEVLRQYVEMMATKYNSKIIGINFKRKTFGYHSSTMAIDFENGEHYSKGGITDPMMRSFRADICMRPSCAECHFKGTSRYSDLTLFDCWHYEQLTGKKDNDGGHTTVLIHTQRGKEIIEGCSDTLDIDSISGEQAIAIDGIMATECVKHHPQRTQYISLLTSKGLMCAIDETIPVSMKEKMIDSSKKVLYRIGLLSLVKQIKGRWQVK